MDFNLNEYPTGGFFGGGYDGSVLADGLDTAKKQSTGSPLGIYTKLPSNGSTSDFQQSRLLRLNRFCLQEISAKLLPKERVNFCLRRTKPRKKRGFVVFKYLINFCSCDQL